MDTEDLNKTNVTIDKTTNKQIIGSLAFVIIFAGLSFSIFLYIQKNKLLAILPKDNTTEYEIQETESTQETITSDLVGKQAIFNIFPDFESLQLDDLPNINSVKTVMGFRDNLLVSGYNYFMEYNPNTKTIEIINSNIFPNIYSIAKDGDKYLYVGVNAHSYFGNYDESKTVGEIYKVNVETGIIENELIGEKDIPSNLVNMGLKFYDNYLWVLGGQSISGSSLFKIDPNTFQIVKEYKPQELAGTKNFSPQCDNPFYFTKENKELQVIEIACKHFVATYNKDTDSWNTVYDESLSSVDKLEYSKEELLNNFKVRIPHFYALSEKTQNDNYFIAADNGIYELSRTQMPKQIVEKDFNLEPYGKNFIVVNQEETKAIIFDIRSEYIRTDKLLPNTDIADIISIYSVNLKTGETTNLTNKMDKNTLFTMLLNYTTDGFSVRSQGNKAILVSNYNNRNLITIDFSTEQTELNIQE